MVCYAINMANKGKFTRTKQVSINQSKFLAAFSQSGIVTTAAENSKQNRNNHYNWLDKDPDYPARFEAAYDSAAETLEQEAITRGRDGWKEPIVYQGEITGHVIKKSDILLMFMLKGMKPEKYRERHDMEHSGQVAMTVEIVKFSETEKPAK